MEAFLQVHDDKIPTRDSLGLAWLRQVAPQFDPQSVAVSPIGTGQLAETYRLAFEGGAAPVGVFQLVAEVLRVAQIDLGPDAGLQLARPLLQQDQHLLAADAGEAVPTRNRAYAVMHHGDVIPVGETAADRVGALGVVLLHARQRVVGEHHAPAERVVGLVAFENRHLVRGIAQLHRDREIEPGRAATQTQHLHGQHPSKRNPRGWKAGMRPEIFQA